MNLLHPDGQDRPTRLLPPANTDWAQVENIRLLPPMRWPSARQLSATAVEVAAAMHAIAAVEAARAREWLATGVFVTCFVIAFVAAHLLRGCAR